MILVDTAVWIDHLRRPLPELECMIDDEQVLTHPMVIGELACGNLADRERTLTGLKQLPDIGESSHADVLAFVESQELMGSGIGYVDAHLICSVLHQHGTRLWTRDSKLQKVAQELGLAHTVP